MLGRVEPLTAERDGGFWDPNKVNLTAIVSCKVSSGLHGDGGNDVITTGSSSH